MIGIASCSVYVPRHRLPRELIAQAWGGRAQPGSKAVSNFDEDASTMGQSAVWRLSGPAPDRLYFASTTSPYWQRSTASQIAAACDWGSETATADFAGGLRSGFSALLAGFDAIVSGAADEVIAAAADRRDAPPESAEEITFGDAAAAVRISREGVTAELAACVSRSDDFLDERRREVARGRRHRVRDAPSRPRAGAWVGEGGRPRSCDCVWRWGRCDSAASGSAGGFACRHPIYDGF